MSEFDARAYYDTLSAPVFIDRDGHRHVGSIVGADTYFQLQTKLRSPLRADGTADRRALDKAMRTVVRTFFPHKWYQFRTKSVEHWLWEMPYVGRMRAVWSFMHSQASMMGITLPPLPGTFPMNTPPEVPGLHATPTSGSSPDSMSASPVSTTVGLAVPVA